MLLPKLGHAGGSGEGDVGLSRAWLGIQPMLGGCREGERGGRQLTAHWLACLQENILWDVPLQARCGHWDWHRRQLESGLKGTTTSGRKPIIGTDAVCGVDSLSVLGN